MSLKISRAILTAAVVALTLVTFTAHGKNDKPATYTDLTDDFTRFFDETNALDEAERVAEFRKRFNPLLPGFFEPSTEAASARYDKRVARAIREFPELRAKYEVVQRQFPAAFAAGIKHFRKQFPGFAPPVPVYLVHSLGEMDGGVRDYGNGAYLIFGADVIARIHEPRDLTALFDHELFHTENNRSFKDCDQVWCPLWAEGLATYAAKVMNPDADDGQLLLTFPKPIRAEVDATWPAALCFARDKLLSRESADLEALFMGGAGNGKFPERFGYYVGLRLAQELGGKYTLPELARLTPDRVQPLLAETAERLIAKSGGCPPAK